MTDKEKAAGRAKAADLAGRMDRMTGDGSYTQGEVLTAHSLALAMILVNAETDQIANAALEDVVGVVKAAVPMLRANRLAREAAAAKKNGCGNG